MEEVDLKYVFTDLEDEIGVNVKFTGFNDIIQLEQFKEFLEESLPLLFFDSDVKH